MHNLNDFVSEIAKKVGVKTPCAGSVTEMAFVGSESAGIVTTGTLD